MTNKEFMERVYQKVCGYEITLCSAKERKHRLDKCWNELSSQIEAGNKWNNLMEMIHDE
tara:strand:+ start:880 stop:1056 length:177 start_codon:yes stop_codon:yes gene_type:complete